MSQPSSGDGPRSVPDRRRETGVPSDNGVADTDIEPGVDGRVRIGYPHPLRTASLYRLSAAPSDCQARTSEVDRETTRPKLHKPIPRKTANQFVTHKAALKRPKNKRPPQGRRAKQI